MSEEQKTDLNLSDVIKAISEQMEASRKRYAFPGEIQFPIEIKGVSAASPRKCTHGEKPGSMVMVRMCDETKATHLGVYLGDLICSCSYFLDKEESKIVINPQLNPAMFVPNLGRIVWGMESFWGPIESEDQLRQVTDAEISDIWYIKALREMSAKEN